MKKEAIFARFLIFDKASTIVFCVTSCYLVKPVRKTFFDVILNKYGTENIKEMEKEKKKNKIMISFVFLVCYRCVTVIFFRKKRASVILCSFKANRCRF